MSSVKWKVAGEYTDIKYHKCEEGIAKITINRPEVRNAFRPSFGTFSFHSLRRHVTRRNDVPQRDELHRRHSYLLRDVRRSYEGSYATL